MNESSKAAPAPGVRCSGHCKCIERQFVCKRLQIIEVDDEAELIQVENLTCQEIASSEDD